MMIVDDEKIIRDGLRKSLPWEEYGISEITDAESGAQALALLQKQLPHFLLTDIKMPGMSGIELIRQIHDNYPEVQIIVISGHDDFEYVREAMRLGASNYLLKPVGHNELAQTIDCAIRALTMQQQTEARHQQSFMLLHQDVVARLVYGRISACELKEKADALDLNLPTEKMCVCVASWVKQRQPVDESWKQYAIANIFKEIFGRESAEFLLDGTDYVTIVFKKFGGDENDYLMHSQFEVCQNIILKTISVDVIFSVGSAANSVKSVATSYTNAIAMLDYRFVFPQGKILYFYEIQKFLEQSKNIPEMDTLYLTNCLKCQDTEAVCDYIHSFFNQLTDPLTLATPHVVKQRILEILVCVYQFVQKKEGKAVSDELCEIKKTAFEAISGNLDREQSRKCVIDAVLQFLSVQKKSPCLNYSRNVKKAVEDIAANYSNQELSLKYIAGILGVNSAYLGRNFKQETGEYFSDYLNRVRIKQAEILLEQNKSGIEIFEQVGFSNYNYFYTVYKKVSGHGLRDTAI